jgi:hypothetical protein
MKHYLNFIKTVGLIEISEPFGFDGSTHKMEQSEFYGRDVILGDEEIQLEINESHFEPLQFPQQLPNGVQFDYASQAFDYFIDVLKNEGWEAEIEYILEVDNVQFSKGIIDGLTAVVGYKTVKFNVIQNTKREMVKRRLDVVIDAFNDEDLDGNEIEPCEAINFLLKAKPIIQRSEWAAKEVSNKQDINTALQSISIVPLCDTLTSFGIKTSFAPFSSYLHIFSYTTETLAQGIADTKIITAETELSFITVKAKNVSFSGALSAVGSYCRVVARRFVAGDLVSLSNVTYTIPIVSGAFSVSNQDYEFYFPLINQGESIQVCLEFGFSSSLLQSYNMRLFNYTCDSLVIETTSTSIDSVIKAVRFIDVLRHACLSTGLDVDAPLFDVGGVHYDNFASNGYLLGQVTDKPFNNTLKDLLNVVREVNNGYQINEDNIEVLHHDDFYKNIEIGAFIEIANAQNQTEYNNDLALKTFEFNYKNSSKGRETNSEGSIDDVHGTTQWLYPSKKTDVNLKIELDHVRSAYLIEEQRRRVFDNQNTTSLSDDNKLFLIKGVSVAPSRRGSFTANLQMQTTATQIKIMANNFRWDLLGFQNGSLITLSGGENSGSFFVTEITPNILTCSAIGLTFNGFSVVTFSYPINNVSYINQTKEGFALIEGIENADNYSNLEYSIGRNMKYWLSYLGSCGRYLTGFVKNTLFEINGNLVTRKNTETVDVADSEPLDLEVIKEMRLYEPRIETVTVFADFDDATTLFERVATDKGYIRTMKVDGSVISGFPREMAYKWSTNELEMKLEPKKESEFYEIDTNILDSFQINNNLFVSLYDVNDILLVTPLRFDKIKINGIVYDDEILFAEALTTAIDD